MKNEYYIEEFNNLAHVYYYYEGDGKTNLGGVKWIATFTDKTTAIWFVDYMNKPKITMQPVGYDEEMLEKVIA